MERVEVYVETSVINGCLSRDPYIVTVSKLFFQKVRKGDVVAHTSTYAIAEIIKTANGAKRDELLSIAALCKVDAPMGRDVEELGKEYVRRGAIPPQYEMGAFRIASATLGAMKHWSRGTENI